MSITDISPKITLAAEKFKSVFIFFARRKEFKKNKLLIRPEQFAALAPDLKKLIFIKFIFRDEALFLKSAQAATVFKDRLRA